MEGLEILDTLGNATLVPIVIFLTQLIKKKVPNFKYGSDVVALMSALVLTIVAYFYTMTPEQFEIWAGGSALAMFKTGIDQVIVAFATWLAASKIYDLGHGDKKRKREVIKEKEELEEQITVLKTNGNNGEKHDSEDEDDLSSKLREILEEGK